MTNFALYRKEMEMLEIAKNQFKAGKFHEGYRESIAELFLESNNHLREDFLEIIPVHDLEWVKKLVFFLSTVVSSGGGRIGSMGGEKTVSGAIDEITRLQEIIKTECNERFHYGVFYSWQSDSNPKYNRNFIEDALKRAIKEVDKKKGDGPLVSLDKDTRDIPGSPDITPAILQKIDRSICFIADATPVTTLNEKQISNPNVMFELGYALSTLSYERVVILCNTAYCNLKDLPFDLGLKRVMAYKYDEKTSEDEKAECKKELTEDLIRALMAIVSL